MSADNTVAIGVFSIAGSDAKEYRVIEAGAIENCDDSDQWPNELTDLYRKVYYGNAIPIANEDEAWKAAGKLYDECMEDFGIVEYGVCKFEYDRPLIGGTIEEANVKLEEWWNKRKENRFDQGE
jgi:hypothetical protein